MDDNKSLAKNSIFSIAYNVVNVVLPLVTTMYVSRILLPYGVGRVAYANTIVSYFVMLAALGLPTYGVRAISRSRDNKADKDKVFSELFVINAIATTLSVIMYLALVAGIPSFREDYILFLIVGIQIPFCFFNIEWLFKGEEDFKFLATRSIAIKSISLVMLILFVKKLEDYYIYALIQSLALCVNYVANIIGSRKYVSFSFKGISLKKHWKPVMFLTVSVLFATVYSKIDITMLGIAADDASVGIYSNAHRIIDIVVSICISITGAFLPRLSYLYKKDKEEFLKIVAKGIGIIGLVVFPSCVGLFLLAGPAVVLLFGEAFAPAAVLVCIFVPMLIIKGFGDLLCHQVVVSIGEEKVLVPVAGLAMVINIVLNLLLIPSMFERGAAIASVISELILNAVLLVFVCKKLKISFPGKDLMKELLGSVIMGGLICVLRLIPVNEYIIFPIAVVCGVCAYFALELVLRNSILLSIIDLMKKRSSE